MTDLVIPDTADEITPEWLSTVLEAHVTGVEIVPVTTGFISTTLRIAVGFADTRTSLPTSLIIKLPDDDEELRGRRAAFYEREAAFYRDLSPELAGLVPRQFFSAHDPESGRSAIVMEDMLARGGVRVGDNVAGCTVAEATDAMRVLARLHARWWNDPRLERLAWLPTHEEVLGDPVHSVTDAWSRFPPAFRALMSPALVETVELFGPRALDVVQRTSQEPWTLTHGDFRLDNLMLGPEGEVTVFDWQTIARGQGAVDAPYFALFSQIDEKPLRDTWQPLLDAYHAALTDSGVAYSREAFAHDARVNSLEGVRTIVMALANLDFADARAQSLGRLLISRLNDMVELLDLPDLLREEFPLP